MQSQSSRTWCVVVACVSHGQGSIATCRSGCFVCDLQVVQKIGAGAHGSAYVVVNKGDVAEKHVLKKIKVDGAADSDRPQAELEVKLLLRLDHPFVLR